MVKRASVVAVLALIAGSIVASCTLFDDDLPSRTCKLDTDCYRAQGEHCDMTAHRCITSPIDAGTGDGATDHGDAP